MKKLIWLFLLHVWEPFPLIFSQQYSTFNAHSHNDYLQNIPFLTAYYSHFGSIEADIWNIKGDLIVGHTLPVETKGKKLDDLYLSPLVNLFKENGGKAWKDKEGTLQLVIDIKTSTEPTLGLLVKKLEKYRNVFDPLVNPNAARIVVTGNTPKPSDFSKYPSYICFDGKIANRYSPGELKRVAMFSESLRSFTLWNGKGNIIAKEYVRLKSIIDSVHSIGCKIRFWEAPDMVNAWKTLMNLGVDYINTDHIEKLTAYLNSRDKCEYISTEAHQVYKPQYINNDSFTRVKNVILLIGDGTGLAQEYAGYTANRGALTLFNFINIGFSKTYSADQYITDSAAGGSALATGKKTPNRHIGTDSLNNPNTNLPEVLSRTGIHCGLVTTDEAVGATPASFYAHASDRDSSEEIAEDFLNSPVNILVGGDPKPFTTRHDGRNILSELNKKGYSTSADLSIFENLTSDKAIVIDDKISRSKINGRGDELSSTVKNVIRLLNKNDKGFFLMVEGAQIDFGGHYNSVPYAVREMLDFDKAVEEAVRFADTNGQTLVIVTADHETGGLSLLDGDFKKGMVDGQFSTNDHTAIMVPVFAYGPRSLMFRGVYENTAVFEKILKAFQISNQ